MRLQVLIDTLNVRLIMLIVAAAVIGTNFNQIKWVSKEVIQQDVCHYYSYLPAFFYEHDLSLSFLSDTVNRDLENRLYVPNRTEDGSPVIKMSMGMAISYLPFFAMAHAYAALFGYPVDGFSEPYQFAVLFSSLGYYLLGLHFLWKVLKVFFPQRIALLSLFCISFATNAFYYMAMGGGMSHIVGFCFTSAFLFYTIRWHELQKTGYSIALGLTAGYLTLVRPVNLLVLIFFALYGVQKTADLRSRFILLFRNPGSMLVIAVICFLVVLPQLIYWKYATGHFFYNSYVGEHFYFNNPHIVEGLFGFRKGLFIYTPIMWLALIGAFFLRGELKIFLVPLLVFFSIYVYVVFSWWCWWYGGSFGLRAMIDFYPLLAVLLATFFLSVRSWNNRARRFIYTLVVALTLLNLFQSAQAKWNIIHFDSMTIRAYFKVFGKIQNPPDIEKYLKHPDYEKALRGEDEDDSTGI